MDEEWTDEQIEDYVQFTLRCEREENLPIWGVFVVTREDWKAGVYHSTFSNCRIMYTTKEEAYKQIEASLFTSYNPFNSGYFVNKMPLQGPDPYVESIRMRL